MKLITALLIILSLLVYQAEAACVTNTIVDQNGRMLVCTTCCSGTMCNTSCF